MRARFLPVLLGLLCGPGTFAACSDDPKNEPADTQADTQQDTRDAEDSTADDTAASDVADSTTPDSTSPPDTTVDTQDTSLPDTAEPPGRPFQTDVLLGEGGFFGISGKVLGPALGADSDIFAISAHYAVLDGGEDAGRVYLFDRKTWPAQVSDALLVLEPPDAAAMGGFGYGLGNACDVNGDTFLDLPVGNHLYGPTVELSASGRVVVFWGDATGFDGTRTTTLRLDDTLRTRSDSIGQTVLCADFDGDGFGDVLAGGQNAGADDTGLAVIWHGSDQGLAEFPDQILTPALLANRQYFGADSLWADLDGDGQNDLAIGAWGLIKGNDPAGVHTGGVAVFLGGDDWSSGPSLSLVPPEDASMNFGGEIAMADDLLVVGASDYMTCEGGGTLGNCCRSDVPCNTGLVCDDAFDFPICTQTCNSPSDCPVGSACINVNLGSTSRDLCLATCGTGKPACPADNQCISAGVALSVCRPTASAAGAIYVWQTGSRTALESTPQRLDCPAGQRGAGFGDAMAYAPDFFEQGKGALLAGMRYAYGGGAVAAFARKADGTGFEPAEPGLLRSPTASDWDDFGSNILSLGDVDGDGLEDFFVGIDSHVEGDPFAGGVQTGGAVLFH